MSFYYNQHAILGVKIPIEKIKTVDGVYEFFGLRNKILFELLEEVCRKQDRLAYCAPFESGSLNDEDGEKCFIIGFDLAKQREDLGKSTLLYGSTNLAELDKLLQKASEIGLTKHGNLEIHLEWDGA